MISIQFEHDLKDSIRTIEDYPKPGIMFRDITTLLGNPRAFRRTVDELGTGSRASHAINVETFN
jgi:adenine/guanine phosphoribosyltransferase-like PRPP-binding protein